MACCTATENPKRFLSLPNLHHTNLVTLVSQGLFISTSCNILELPLIGGSFLMSNAHPWTSMTTAKEGASQPGLGHMSSPGSGMESALKQRHLDRELGRAFLRERSKCGYQKKSMGARQAEWSSRTQGTPHAGRRWEVCGSEQAYVTIAGLISVQITGDNFR